MSASQAQSLTPQMVSALHRALQQQHNALLLNRQRTAALEARLALLDQGRTPRMPIEFRAQYGEDLWIWDILGHQTEGFFIEVGAFDGYHFSATFGLEAMGWNGLLIEALPKQAEVCRQRRPHSRVVHSALGRRDASGTVEFVSVQDEHGGMLSYVEAGTEHSRRVAAQKLQTSTIEVPVTSLDALLEGHSGPIDAAVIDVEGAELDVLDGFSLDRFKPRLLLLEDNSGGRNSALGDYMAKQPYVFAGWLAVDRLYVRAGEESMLQRLKRS